jgi:hypothetical protein
VGNNLHAWSTQLVPHAGERNLLITQLGPVTGDAVIRLRSSAPHSTNNPTLFAASVKARQVQIAGLSVVPFNSILVPTF